jgi:hypothetical protein
MKLWEPVSQNGHGARACSKASVRAPDKVDTLSARYTMCIYSAVQSKAKVRHARSAVHRQLRSHHPSR